MVPILLFNSFTTRAQIGYNNLPNAVINNIKKYYDQAIANIPTSSCIQTPILFGGTINCNQSPFKLVFQSEFNGDVLDVNKWYTYGPTWPNKDDQCEFCRTHGDYEDQVYLDQNVIVSNGKATLRAKKETYTWFGKTKGYTSGMLYSDINFNHGKFEIRCKLPSQPGFWPAFWMWGFDEIDVFEYCTQDPTNQIMSVHMEDCDNDGGMEVSSKHHSGIDASDGFHTYSVEWDPNFIDWRTDGQLVRRVHRFMTITGSKLNCGDNVGLGTYWFNDIIANQRLHVIANLSVNASHVNNFCYNSPPPSNTNFPIDMEIDYIRVWQRDIQQDLTNLCASRYIQGADKICVDNTSYKIELVGGYGNLNWNVTSNLQIVSTGDNYIYVKRVNGVSGEKGLVYLNESNSPCGTNLNLVHEIAIGGPSLSYAVDVGGCGDPIKFTATYTPITPGSFTGIIDGNYCFSLPQGGPIGQTPTYYTATHQPNDNDYCYPFTLTATNSCGTTTKTGLVKDNCVYTSPLDCISVNKRAYLNSEELELNATLFPNPAHNSFELNFSNYAEFSVKQCTVVNAINSTEVHNITEFNSTNQIDCSNWERGYYFLKFETENQEQFYRLLLLK